MHRFFVSPEKISEQKVTIQGPDVTHIRTVLRMKTGDRIQVLDGQGLQYEVCLTGIAKDRVEGEIVSQASIQTESPINILMGQALIKGSGFDNLVRKATELGVHSIVPLTTRRCVARLASASEGDRAGRWQRIAEEAAKQCGRSQVPEVNRKVLSVEEFCRQAADCDLKLVFWEDEDKTRLKGVDAPDSVGSIAFLAGPEGGWAEDEIEFLRKQGFQPVTLGPRTLKADSASLVILSLLQHCWGDM